MTHTHHINSYTCIKPKHLSNPRNFIRRQTYPHRKQCVLSISQKSEIQYCGLQKCSKASGYDLLAPAVKSVGVPSGNSEQIQTSHSYLTEHYSASLDVCKHNFYRAVAEQNYEKQAEQGAISEEEAEARKRSAKAATEAKNEELEKKKYKKFSKKDLFLPAGQTSQMIVGAGEGHDRDIIKRSQSLYDDYSLKRVYYSAYVPVRDNSLLPKEETPLLREHRIYQADFLMRFYGFRAGELLSEKKQDFDLNIDPKMDYAIENYSSPIEINKASLEELLKIPGFGPKSARKIIKARKSFNLSFYDLKKLRISTKRAINFITVSGKYYGEKFDSREALRSIILERENSKQLSFF